MIAGRSSNATLGQNRALAWSWGSLGGKNEVRDEELSWTGSTDVPAGCPSTTLVEGTPVNSRDTTAAGKGITSQTPAMSSEKAGAS